MCSTSASWQHYLTVTVEMLYCRMLVKWFSRKAGPLFISSFGSSVVEHGDSTDTRGRIPYRPWLPASFNRMPVMTKTVHPTPRAGSTPARSTKAVNQCQEEYARPAANSKKTKQHSSTNARHSMRSAGCVACQSTMRHRRTQAMTVSISITCSPSRSIQNYSSTQQASSQATPAATDCAATVTRQRQSEHSQDNG